MVVVAEIDAEDCAPGTARGELRNLTGRCIRVSSRSKEEGAEFFTG